MRTVAGVSLMVIATLLFGGCSAPAGGPAAEQSVPSAAPGTPVAEEFTPIIGAVLEAPLIVPATDGSTHLAYELLLTNVIGQQVNLTAITVEGDGKQLLRLAEDQLTPWVRAMGAASLERVLAPGQRGIVTLDVTIPNTETVPKELKHVLEFSPESAMPPMIQTSMKQTIAVVQVDRSAPVVISSPVSGPNWLDGNSCCEVTPHRAAINPVNGSLYAPERFAIDFVQLNENGRIFDGAIDEFESYAYFGANILAVADGPIVSMGWELPDEKPGAHPVGLELHEYGGNFVVQDIGNGRYAFYAHLQGNNPEELTVGQKLRRGDIIGQLGNSGNTDMPHLHFHIMDSPLPLGSNGLPFLIDSFALVGSVTQPALVECMENPVSCGVESSSGTKMKARSPLYRDLMNFGG